MMLSAIPSVLFRLLFVAAAAVMLAAIPARAAPKCQAAAYVQGAGEAYDRAARSGSATVFANAVARYTNLTEMSFFALGRYRKDLPKAREAEYLALTRRFIGGFMVQYGKGFRASDLTITECKTSGGLVVVTAQLSTGGKVIFRLSKGGGYSIRDMNIKGVWLAQQLRSTFVGTITRTGSIDGLFAYLKR
jgi:ABC-type transporter MlaC component